MTTITKRSVDLATAEKAIEAATAKARAMGLNMSIAIVDEAGDLCAFRRMQGTPRLTIDIAINKASRPPPSACRPMRGGISSRTIRRFFMASPIRRA